MSRRYFKKNINQLDLFDLELQLDDIKKLQDIELELSMNDKLSQQELELKQKLVSKQKEKNYNFLFRVRPRTTISKNARRHLPMCFSL